MLPLSWKIRLSRLEICVFFSFRHKKSADKNQRRNIVSKPVNAAVKEISALT
tara:strand:+ start:9406 stop:9561 length:156 start_codon:yes stop_codon:yes gene_type:complete